MIGYVSVKGSAKGKRREAEKLSHGMIHKIGAIVADVRKEGETLIECISRITSIARLVTTDTSPDGDDIGAGNTKPLLPADNTEKVAEPEGE